MKLILFPLLSKKSKKAIKRDKKRFGRTYRYTPRSTLINRLREQTGLSYEQVYKQLIEERTYLLKYPQYEF